MLQFQSVSFAYQSTGAPRRAVDELSLSLAPGEIVALVGSNGSGKSTAVRLANGLLLPDSGAVLVDELNTRDSDVIDVRRRVGIVFQRPDDQIVATTVEDDCAFGPENLGLPREQIRARVDAALAAVGLADLARREPHLLSGGQKQRLAIAGALAMQPRYVVMDEPTSMLDPEGRADVLAVMDELRAAGHGILHVTHDLAEAVRADRVVVIDAGRAVFEGAALDLFRDEERLAAWGLETPPIARLAGALRERGFAADVRGFEPGQIAGALCD